MEELWVPFVNVGRICFGTTPLSLCFYFKQAKQTQEVCGWEFILAAQAGKGSQSLRLLSETAHANLNLSLVIPANILIPGKGNPRLSSFCKGPCLGVAQ